MLTIVLRCVRCTDALSRGVEGEDLRQYIKATSREHLRVVYDYLTCS